MTKEFVLDIFTLFWTRLDKMQCGTVRDGAGRCRAVRYLTNFLSTRLRDGKWVLFGSVF